MLFEIGSIGSVKEAESIGEGLVNIDRLIPVCLGVTQDREHIAASGALYFDSNTNTCGGEGGSLDTGLDSAITTSTTSPAMKGDSKYSGGMRNRGEFVDKFCNSTTYIYTYPGPAKQTPLKSKPLFTLFGDVISVSIPGLVCRSGHEHRVSEITESVLSDENSDTHSYSFELGDSVHSNSGHSDNFSALRDAVRTSSPLEKGPFTPRSPEEKAGATVSSSDCNHVAIVPGGFVEYEIKLQNSSEEWNVYRRSVSPLNALVSYSLM